MGRYHGETNKTSVTFLLPLRIRIKARHAIYTRASPIRGTVARKSMQLIRNGAYIMRIRNICIRTDVAIFGDIRFYEETRGLRLPRERFLN